MLQQTLQASIEGASGSGKEFHSNTRSSRCIGLCHTRFPMSLETQPKGDSLEIEPTSGIQTHTKGEPLENVREQPWSNLRFASHRPISKAPMASEPVVGRSRPDKSPNPSHPSRCPSSHHTNDAASIGVLLGQIDGPGR